MDRSILSDEQFERVAPHLPGKVGDPGRTANNRLFLEAVFWIARTGAPWRDLGPRFGLWNSVYRRFRRWAEKGVSRVYSSCCPPTRTSNTPSSTAPSSGSTSMAPAQGGDSKSGHRPIERRADDENRRARRCARQPGALPAASRPTPRQHRRCAVDRGYRLRGPAGRQGLRHRLDPRRTGQPRRHGRHSTQGRSGAYRRHRRGPSFAASHAFHSSWSPQSEHPRGSTKSWPSSYATKRAQTHRGGSKWP